LNNKVTFLSMMWPDITTEASPFSTFASRFEGISSALPVFNDVGLGMPQLFPQYILEQFDRL
jgi:hypothetical protein